MVENCGISFGIIFPGLRWLIGLGLFGLTIWWVKSIVKDCRVNWGWFLVIVGGWGNLAQRFWGGGCVVDNLTIPLMPIKNNIFDWVIFLGVVLVIGGIKWKNPK